MFKEVRITRSQPPCEKLALYMEIISSLLSGYHNQKRKAKKESAGNKTEINEDNVLKLIEAILSVIGEIKRRLDTSAEDNYTRYSSKSKELVHVAVRGWLDANDDNRKLFMRIVNNRDLSHNELSDIIMQNICRYCLGQIKKLANSNLVAEEIHDKAQRGELEVLNMKRIFESKKGMSHLKLLLASLIEVRNILSGTSGTSARLMHSYIVREVEKNLLLTIKVPKDSDLTIEEATEHMIYKYGSLDQNIIEEERDTRYQIPHFIQYHKTDSVRTKAFSRKIFGVDIITEIQEELKNTPDEYYKKNIEVSAKKINKFAEVSRQSIEMLFEQLEKSGSGIYKKIGKALKELSNDLIELWDKTNKDINNTANRLKGALSDMIKVLKDGQLEVYPIVDVSSGELIDSLHKFKYDVLNRIIKGYLRGKISDDRLRNTILYVTLKYSRDLYRDLIRLFRAKREEMYFAKTGRKIYNYDELILLPQKDEISESESAEARKSINADRIAELIASILIYYVLMHYLKHYERDGLYGDINELGIIDYLNFMLINLESFQASLYDIFYSTMLQFVAKSGSLSFLLHNYIRLDNMMYLASIMANFWPLFAPFFSTSSANVWTVYREIENETFAQHDVGPGIVTDDIISEYDNNPKERPFVIFTQIPSLWPWNRKSKGIKQISRKELLKLEEQYKKWKLKQKEKEGQKTEEKYLPTRTTLEELKNDPIIQKLSSEMQEEISILQSIINGYNVVLDLRLLRLHIFYQLNLVYENYKNLKQTIKEHLQKGGLIYDLKKESDQKVEMELNNPIFVKDMQEQISTSKNNYDFDISHVNFAIDIYAPINTIVTRLFFICGLSMQSETGYYIVGEGVVEKEEAKRNFTNWSKSLLYNDADYLIAAYSLNKGLGIVSNKFAKKIKPNSKIVSWVRDKLIKETKRIQPIAEKMIKVHEKIKRILDGEDEESKEV
jgi:hypothetical protein